MSLENELDLTIFVACYNEEANIVAALESIRNALRGARFTWEIIVIDDGSRDRSVELVEQYARAHPELPIRLVINEINRGLAQNYIEGAFLGRGKYYRLVCGDNTEDAEILRDVLTHVGKGDMVIFYHADNRRALFRRILSRFFTILVNLVSGHRLHYYNGCAIHLRYNVMRWHTNYHGFGFQADLLCRLLDQKFGYVEVPIRAIERVGGRSKALTLKNLLSVSHTFLDLFIRRVAKLMYGRRSVRPKWHERLDLHGPAKKEEPPAAAQTSVAAGAGNQT